MGLGRAKRNRKSNKNTAATRAKGEKGHRTEPGPVGQVRRLLLTSDPEVLRMARAAGQTPVKVQVSSEDQKRLRRRFQPKKNSSDLAESVRCVFSDLRDVVSP